MSHPIMFDDADPMLALVREHALAFPDADEKISHGRPAFFTKKVFAYYGWNRKRGEGDWVRHDRALVILPAPDERLALLEAGAWIPPYLGYNGWVAIDLNKRRAARIEEYLDMSFRQTAPLRAIRTWDALRPR